MNTQNLKDNYPKLIDYMARAGYCTTYIIKVRREIDYVLSGAVQTGRRIKIFIWSTRINQIPGIICVTNRIFLVLLSNLTIAASTQTDGGDSRL